jgi:hypothetical protein
VRRAQLMVWCAQEILGAACPTNAPSLQLNLSVQEFQVELLKRSARSHPELALRSESSIERARLERSDDMKDIPRVILRKGAPRKIGQVL